MNLKTLSPRRQDASDLRRSTERVVLNVDEWLPERLMFSLRTTTHREIRVKRESDADTELLR